MLVRGIVGWIGVRGCESVEVGGKLDVWGSETGDGVL